MRASLCTRRFGSPYSHLEVGGLVGSKYYYDVYAVEVNGVYIIRTLLCKVGKD